MEITSKGFKKPAENEYYSIEDANHNAQLTNDLFEGVDSAIGQLTNDLFEGVDSAIGQLTNDLFEGVDSAIGQIQDKIINSSGSNANGEWIRFEDGTQICRKLYSSPYTAFTSAPALNGTTWQAEIGTKSFPADFISDPVVLWDGDVRLGFSYSNQGNVNKGYSPVNTVSVTTAIVFSPNQFDRVYQLNYIAIGRWK